MHVYLKSKKYIISNQRIIYRPTVMESCLKDNKYSTLMKQIKQIITDKKISANQPNQCHLCSIIFFKNIKLTLLLSIKLT